MSMLVKKNLFMFPVVFILWANVSVFCTVAAGQTMDPAILVTENASISSDAGASADSYKDGLIDVLKFKDIEIGDVLNFISKRSGLNIVAGQNVTGKVTIYFKNVEVEDALRVILESNGLAYAQEGNIMRVMNAVDFETMYGHKFNERIQTKVIPLSSAHASEVVDLLREVKSSAGKVLAEGASDTVILMDSADKLEAMTALLKQIDVPRSTVVFSLNYVRAEDVIGKVNEMLTPNIGKMRFDAQSNKIIATDTPRKIKEITNVIEAFDVKEKQVLIEAKIVQVILNDETKMGINWQAVIAKYQSLDFKSSFSILKPEDKAGRVSIGALDNNNFTAMIEALQSVGKTRILSNPHIMATNNKEARILVGSNEPYATSTTTTTAAGPVTTAESVTFIAVGVKLRVTPSIHNDGYITMNIKPEVSGVTKSITTADNNTIPVVETSEAETTVTVKDGVTVVIGGLIKNEKTNDIKKVPVLGDIPLLGLFFRSKDNSTQKTELVIFLTPKIMTGDISVASVPEE